MASVAVGIVVALAWLFRPEGWEYVVAILPRQIPAMRLVTAVCFVLAGMQFLFHRWGQWRAMAACACAIMALMGGSIYLVYVPEATEADIKLTLPMLGRPSIETAVLFLLIAAYGIIETTHGYCLHWFRLATAWALMAGGTMSLIGYMAGLPLLYASIPVLGSTGMALNTSACFAFLGIAVLNLKSESFRARVYHGI